MEDNMQSNSSTTVPNPSHVPQPHAEPMTGTVTNHAHGATQELSGGAQAGIGIAIGTCNVCCSPICYGCPTLLSSMVGIILYFVWKQEKPQTAKNILMVTLITAAVGFLIVGVLFVLGLASSFMDYSSYNY